MRKVLIAGNWKMNGSKVQTAELLNALFDKLLDLGDKIECLVCPASPYLDYAREIINKANKVNILLGAQNLASKAVNAFTGEISPAMLHEFGCSYVIIGHSERRKYLHESNELVALKVGIAIESNLRPIVCVGETEAERSAGVSYAVVAKQLQAVLDEVCVSEMQNAAIAYEPVWAIGTGMSATPEQAQSMHAYIRQLVADYDTEIAAKIRIIYGGSVTSANAVQLLQQPDIDGCLVGGASLKAQDFSDICHAAMGITK